jgi:Tol biopolymer transport system component
MTSMPDTKQRLRDTRDRIAPPPDVLGRLERRRQHKEGMKRVAAAVVAIVVALVGLGGWSLLERDAARRPADPSEENLGIFAPVSGRIVYERGDDIWSVDPSMEGDSRQVAFTSQDAIPLDWSSDGSDLLLMRTIDGEQVGAMPANRLSVLHADGSETPLITEPMSIDGATISPDGSRVVFAGWSDDESRIYGVEVATGRVEVLLDSHERQLDAFPEPVTTLVYAPTFSPDGTRIGYLDGMGDHSHSVWVMNADGTGAHEIVSNATTTEAGHVFGLAWSPTGDRIALGLRTLPPAAIYTFAPDGSDFTRVITNGLEPHWSPDGSKIAFQSYIMVPCRDEVAGDLPPEADPESCVTEEPSEGLGIANADGSDARTFGFAASGPWHPGTSVEDAPPPEIPTPTPDTTSGAPWGPSALAYGVNGDIFLAEADGSNAVRIADGVLVDGAEECAPGEERADYIAFGTAWSPDGRYLAYWDRGCPWQVRDDPEDAWGIVRITDAAGNVIASFPGQGWQISWSPDSTRVAVMDVWAPADERDATISIYGLDGVRQATLTVPSPFTPSGDYSPVWSRDGSAILLRSVQVPLDGGAPTPLTGGSTGFGVYSPDGSRFAYVDRGSLIVEDADEPDAQKVSGAWEFWDVAWSPNGDLVAFAADGTELLVRDVASGADTSLLDVTQSEFLEVIEFSPNGDRILFKRSDADGGASSLWSIAANGSDLRRLLDGIDWADLQPQGRPS